MQFRPASTLCGGRPLQFPHHRLRRDGGQGATYIFTTPQTARALPAAEILRRFTAFQGGKATLRAYAADTVRQAVQMALQLAQNLSEQTNRSASASKPVPPLVFIGGPAFVVAEALPLFRQGWYGC